MKGGGSLLASCTDMPLTTSAVAIQRHQEPYLTKLLVAQVPVESLNGSIGTTDATWKLSAVRLDNKSLYFAPNPGEPGCFCIGKYGMITE